MVFLADKLARLQVRALGLDGTVARRLLPAQLLTPSPSCKAVDFTFKEVYSWESFVDAFTITPLIFTSERYGYSWLTVGE